MARKVASIQIYDPYAVELVNAVAQREGRRAANVARFYLTQILIKRLKELNEDATSIDSSQQPAVVAG